MKRIAAALGVVLGLGLVAGPVVADGLDPRGWTEGEPAANASAVLSGLAERPEIALPEALARQIKRRPALLVYFSPTCPHCRHAQPELSALAARLGRKVDVIGVATGQTTPEQLDEFRAAFDVPYPLIVDEDREIGAAMGVRGTPSALLVRREGEVIRAVDGWYPYVPGYDTFVEMRVAADPWSAFRPGEYHGVAVCAGCHSQEAASWQLTHHSVAWNTLVVREDHQDAECTACHVTGAGQPTGWDGSPESHLVDVGCEACHGPGGPHDGAATEPATTCEGCHDAKHSIAFTYEKGLPLVDHYRANGMEPEAFWAARSALYDGTAPRALLAFADGAFVGSAACVECHEAEHAQWAATPHARAMDTLRAEATLADHPGADADVACVQCHTSPTRSGPSPAELSGYRVDESVGCESCHGPGEAHVAAGGGLDNIQRLGESCPVCVLESICTSCHTAQWDPEWDLEARLGPVRHGASVAE